MANPRPIRGRAYTVYEDILLAQSWVAITQDPLIGSDQTGNQFWNRIYLTFENLSGCTTDRTAGSLSSRFSTMAKEVSLYIAKLSGVNNRAASGTTNADKVRDARLEYMQSAGKPFKFEECYEILKDQPKFSIRTTQVFENVPNSQFVDGGCSTPSPTNVQWDSDIPIDLNAPSPLSRPPGRKEAKKKGKRTVEASDVSAMVEETRNFNNFYMSNQKDRLELKQRDFDFRVSSEEDRIMAMDLSSLPDHQRYYFLSRQHEIAQKRGYHPG